MGIENPQFGPLEEYGYQDIADRKVIPMRVIDSLLNPGSSPSI